MSQSLSLTVDIPLQCSNQFANRTDMQFTSQMKTETSNEQLMLQYAKGDLLSFETLYERHKGGLYRFCLRQINNQAIAEECFQEIWLKLINSRVNYQPKALFTTYLYRIAQNHIIDTFRKNKNNNQNVALDEATHSQVESVYDVNTHQQKDIADELIQQKKYQRLRTEIELLPLEQKTALLLKMDAGLSLEEIACVLDCGRETVKSRLRYASKRLKELLGEII